MLSRYFEIKTNTEKFDNDIKWTMGEIKDKRVLLYGAGEGFVELNKKYDFLNNLNISCVADKKFTCDKGEEFRIQEYMGLRTIPPERILLEDYDVILITNESAQLIIDYLKQTLLVEKEIRTVFNEDIKDERANYLYLDKFNFDKTLPKLVKKLKNKSVVLYGAGAMLELMKTYFDISGLNVIGISDRRFDVHDKNEKCMGYKVYSLEEVKALNPDYVLVVTKFYIGIIEDMYYNIFKGTKIKIKPLLKKPFMTLVNEIWK